MHRPPNDQKIKMPYLLKHTEVRLVDFGTLQEPHLYAITSGFSNPEVRDTKNWKVKSHNSKPHKENEKADFFTENLRLLNTLKNLQGSIKLFQILTKLYILNYKNKNTKKIVPYFQEKIY